MVKFEIEGTEMAKKEVGSHGNSGMVLVPKAWRGHKVIIILDGK